MHRKRRNKHRRNKFGIGIIIGPAAVILIGLIVLFVFIFRGENEDEGTVSDDTAVSVDLCFNDPVSEDAAEAISSYNKPAEPCPRTVSSPLAERFYDGYEVTKDGRARYIGEEDVISRYAVLIDMQDGHIVAYRNENDQIYPASMTKVLSVYTACELLPTLSGNFSITQEIANYTFSNDCSAVCYSISENVPVEELFYGTILPSGADACLALAQKSAGTTENFVMAMNAYCARLGISDTAHFANPVGIFDENNYCTVVDMSMIMKAALEKDICYKALSTHKYTTAKRAEHPDGLNLSNIFLRRIEDREMPGVCLAAKTGFVNESKNCAVSCFESNSGKLYILCTAMSDSARDARADHAYIYSHYTE